MVGVAGYCYYMSFTFYESAGRPLILSHLSLKSTWLNMPVILAFGLKERNGGEINSWLNLGKKKWALLLPASLSQGMLPPGLIF
jgi:hypothetical protein